MKLKCNNCNNDLTKKVEKKINFWLENFNERPGFLIQFEENCNQCNHINHFKKYPNEEILRMRWTTEVFVNNKRKGE